MIMPTATSSNLRLFNHNSPPINGSGKGKRKNMPWVDVSDEDSLTARKRINGRSILSPSLVNRPQKRQRTSSGGTLNGRPQLNGQTTPKPKAIERSLPKGGLQKPLGLQDQRKALPIAKGRDALIDEIRRNDVTVLLGETGSGKTTQVPQYLLESGLAGTGVISVTQPRRVAATSLATRVAAEQNVNVGGLVGYAVRFDERTGPQTRIKYMTDGMIVRELLSDPDLTKYSVVIVDEAHERTLRTDLLLANLKTIQQRRNSSSDTSEKGKGRASNPLKIIIMSATLDAEKFAKFFSNAKIVYVQGRQHPVKIYHSSVEQNDYIVSAMRTFFQIHLDRPAGDVLIFLPSQEDIESLEKSIYFFANQLPTDSMRVDICPMYASQAPRKNSRVFAPAAAKTRKCILATNIAETSITIPGVKYVIDTGKCKEKRYLAGATNAFETLLLADITQSSAMQRTGRAGREGMGYCFRLYTEKAFKAMDVSPEPEIRRCNLTASFLELKLTGQDLQELDLMDKPEEDTIGAALRTLLMLGALSQNKELTETGRQMASFPLEPIYSRVVIASKDYKCTSEVITIISVLSASSKLYFDNSDDRETVSESRRKFRHSTGDHLTILNVVRAYEDIKASESKEGRRTWCRSHFLNERTLLEAAEIKAQLEMTCRRKGIDPTVSCGESDEPVLRSLVQGLFTNSAFLQKDGSYKQTVGQSTVKIHPGSVLIEKKVPAIIYDELTYTSDIYARGVSSVPRTFLSEVHAFNMRSAQT